MQSAHCCICFDPLDSGGRDVAAIQCGHLFHAVCIEPWVAKNNNCPHCRCKATPSAIIHKLFFDGNPGKDAGRKPEEIALASEAELSRVKADLEEVRCRLTVKSHMADKLSVENSTLSEKIAVVTDSLRALETIHRQEVDKNKLLRLELTTAQNSCRQAAAVREEAAALRQKVTELQNVQTVINGTQDEVDDLIRQTSDRSQLATWCAVYKAELARKRTECRGLSDSVRQTRRELDAVRSKLGSVTAELLAANSRNTALEEDLAAQNREMSALRKKMEALQAALGSPSDTVPALARRLLNESPAPFNLVAPQRSAHSVFVTPRLSAPTDSTREIDLDVSADLFDSPDLKPTNKRPRQESSTAASPAFSISTASSAAAAQKSAAQNVAERGSRPVFGCLDPRRTLQLRGAAVPQAALSSNSSSAFHEGYNGMGGHEKVVVPSAPRNKFRKTVSQPAIKKNVFGPSKTAKTPTLPSLDGYLSRSDSENRYA